MAMGFSTYVCILQVLRRGEGNVIPILYIYTHIYIQIPMFLTKNRYSKIYLSTKQIILEIHSPALA